MRKQRWVRRVWPPLFAVAVVLVVWQIVYLSKYFSPAILPSPAQAFDSLRLHLGNGTLERAVRNSLIRMGVGFGFSVIVGTAIGIAEARWRFFNDSFGALIAGLQSLPSVAWLPLSLLWFGLTERAVLFVVVIGSLPAVAIATRGALATVPPILGKAGRTLGLRGWKLQWKVMFPAAIPTYVDGLQQGWAFAWRSLMAGELIVAGGIGLGQTISNAGLGLDAALVIAGMIVIVAIGMTVDLVVFGLISRKIREGRGLALATGSRG